MREKEREREKGREGERKGERERGRERERERERERVCERECLYYGIHLSKIIVKYRKEENHILYIYLTFPCEFIQSWPVFVC